MGDVVKPPKLPKTGEKIGESELSDYERLQLEIAHAARALQVLSMPGAAWAAVAAQSAMQEAVLWSTCDARRAVWLDCQWALLAGVGVSAKLAVRAGMALADARADAKAAQHG